MQVRLFQRIGELCLDFYTDTILAHGHLMDAGKKVLY